MSGSWRKDGTQPAGEGEALFFVYGNLSDAANLIFDGIFDGDDLVFVVFDFIDGGVERGGLTGTCGAGDEDHAVGLVDVTAEARDVLRVEADYIEIEVTEFFAERFFVEHAKHGVFSVNRRHDRDAEVDETAFVANAEAAILRDAALGDIEFGHHFNSGKDRGVPFFGERLHGVLQDAIDAVLDDDFGVARFDVDVTGAALEGGENHGIDEADDGADAGIARQFVHSDVFVAVFFVADDLQRETFGGLVEDALRLLGALQEVVDLRGGGDFYLEALIQEKRELVGLLQLAGIGDGYDEGAVVALEWYKFVAKHHFRGDAAEKLGVDALFAKIDERAAITLGEAAGLISLGGVVRNTGGNGIHCGHYPVAPIWRENIGRYKAINNEPITTAMTTKITGETQMSVRWSLVFTSSS